MNEMGIGFWLTTIAGLIGAAFVYAAGRVDAKAEIAKDPTVKIRSGLTIKGLVSFLAVIVAFGFAAAGNVVKKIEQDAKDEKLRKAAKEQARIEGEFKASSQQTLGQIKEKSEALERLLANVDAVGTQTKEKVDQSLRDLGSTSAKVDESSSKLTSVATRQEDSIKSLEGLAKGQLQSLQDLWRNRHGIGQVSGSAWITIDLLNGKSTVGLATWLNRVEERYKNLKASKAVLDTAPLGNDVNGNEYLEINALTYPKRNWDLIPQGENETFVDALFFNSHYILLATSGERRGLLSPVLSFEAKATSVKIYFDSVTKKPKKIEGFAEGKGRFSPIAGQFTNWVDFYGAMLIARQLFSVYPLPEAFASVEYRSITFEAEDNQWNPSAQFATYTGADLFTDERRSLIVMNADWKTLGKVPRDYPGKRLPQYGPAPEPW